MLIIITIILATVFFGLSLTKIKTKKHIRTICDIQSTILIVAGIVGLLILFWITQIPAYNSISRQIDSIEHINKEMMIDINKSVQDYYNITTDVYSQIESGTLFVEYPEVKSDIIEQQIEEIMKNNEEVKKAKLKKIQLEENLRFYLLYTKGE